MQDRSSSISVSVAIAFPIGIIVTVVAFVLNLAAAKCGLGPTLAIVWADRLLVGLFILCLVPLLAVVLCRACSRHTVLFMLWVVVVPAVFICRLITAFSSDEQIAARLEHVARGNVREAALASWGAVGDPKEADYDTAAAVCFGVMFDAVEAASRPYPASASVFLDALRRVALECDELSPPLGAGAPPASPAERHEHVCRFLAATYGHAIQSCHDPAPRAKAIRDYGLVVAHLADSSVTAQARTTEGWLIGCERAVAALAEFRQRAHDDGWTDREMRATFDCIVLLDRRVPGRSKEREALIYEALKLARSCARTEDWKGVAPECLQFAGDRLRAEIWSDQQTIDIADMLAEIAATEREAEVWLCYLASLAEAAGKQRAAESVKQMLDSMGSDVAARRGLARIPSTKAIGPFMEWQADSLTAYRELRSELGVAMRGSSSATLATHLQKAVRQRRNLLGIANARVVPYEGIVLHASYVNMLRSGIEAIEALQAGDGESFTAMSARNSVLFSAVCESYERCRRDNDDSGPPLSFAWEPPPDQ